ncbi:MAG: phospho-sugar mutase [Actinomycetota bacterium]|nr:phospho-sugar mutase [Actinomycetota bacterium]
MSSPPASSPPPSVPPGGSPAGEAGLERLLDVVSSWIADDPHADDARELGALFTAAAAGRSEAVAELRDRFTGPLTFGTAGLRGPLRAGPGGMNAAVVRRAAAGLAGYLTACGTIGAVVVGYDARHRSQEFAHDSAAVLTAAGFQPLVLPRPLPTPVLAFAIGYHSAVAGVMVTASHNPPQDNGYKVYLGDGAQIVSPADAQIQAAIAAVGSTLSIPMAHDFVRLDDSVVTAYVNQIAGLVDPNSPRDISVAYTAMHGVGSVVLRDVFEKAGYPAPDVVAAQDEPDADFPTVGFPNPEEPGAMDRLLQLVAATGSELGIANDPDADRCAIASQGRMLSGDEVGVLLADHLLARGATGTFAASIVSSSLLGKIAAAQGVPYAETLTGFKWIVRAPEVTGVPLSFGYEEALGYAVAPALVRDKDGISAALLFTELAARLKARGATVDDRLDELAVEHGLHATRQISIRVERLAEIGELMQRLRQAPPTELLGRVVGAEDLLPDADVLRFRGEGVRVIVRPSGTEPKLKTYLEVVVPVLPDAGILGARGRAADELETLHAQVSALLARS